MAMMDQKDQTASIRQSRLSIKQSKRMSTLAPQKEASVAAISAIQEVEESEGTSETDSSDYYEKVLNNKKSETDSADEISFSSGEFDGISVHSAPSPVSSEGENVVYPFKNPLAQDSNMRTIKLLPKTPTQQRSSN
jgi:hypothetical protein